MGTPSNGPKRVPLGMTPVLHTPSVCETEFTKVIKSIRFKFSKRKKSDATEVHRMSEHCTMEARALGGVCQDHLGQTHYYLP